MRSYLVQKVLRDALQSRVACIVQGSPGKEIDKQRKGGPEGRERCTP